ncbi:MAG: lysophospholipid acyltransferase family protein [Victivallaceae bacterium]|jgi:KDO2-lipid IV(A) lauroyltransferase
MPPISVTAEPKENRRKRKKNDFRIWLEFIPFWFLYVFIRALPLKAASGLSRILFKLMFALDKKHRIRTIRHILHAGITADEQEAVKTARQVYNNFSQLLVEIIKMNQLYSPEKVGLAGCRDTMLEVFGKDGKRINVIIITAHYGNWEVAGTAYAEKTGNPMVSIMRPFNNPLIGRYILRNRESGLHQSIPKEGGIKGLLRALKDGKTIAILADQHAGSSEGVETVFFGQPCRTHSSPALLHLKTGVPVMPVVTRRRDNNFNFEFVLGELIRYTPTGDKGNDIKTVTQMYTTALEKLIAEQPEQWMWVHRRWLNIHRDGSRNSSAARRELE